jgi:hypothetical protein
MSTNVKQCIPNHINPDTLYTTVYVVTKNSGLQDPSESGMSKLTTKTKNETILTHVPSLRPHKMPPKRRGTGMSIVNPGSKRIHRKPGVQYEEEDSDT